MADGEQRLVWLARSGDREAFSELVSLFETRVYRAAYALTGNEEEAKDLSQETFLKAYRGMGGFRGKCSFFTWLYRILLNSYKTSLRKKRSMPETVANDKWSDVGVGSASSSLSGVELASDRETVDRVYVAVGSLPPEQKMVAVMRFLEEMTYEEIARAMRCSMGTVKSRIHAARLSLKKMLLDESELHHKKR